MILLVFAIIESISFLGIAPSLTSVFLYPLNLTINGVLLFSSLLGLYGIFTGNRLGACFSLLTPIAETILAFTFFVSATLNEAKFAWTLVFQALPIVSLGTLGFFFVSKALEESVFRLMETNGRRKSVEAEANDYAVEVINVTKKYVMGSVVVPAINGLTMRVRKGEFVAVMGPSGCGKSTLLNLIGALDRPTSGHILIDGIDISKLGALALAQLRNEKVGFVFQAYNLINRSNVLRNVELPMLVRGVEREQRIKRISEMLNVVGLSGMEFRKPKTLSGGEQQRVAIARALVNSPRIVLADEPTGNLDSKAGMEILSFLRRTNKELGTTVILVTHNKEAADMADRIIYLRDGKIEREELVGGQRDEQKL
jgi:putative ABC transport system ATP-binding protein